MNYLSTHSPFTPAEKAAKQSLFKDFGCLFFRFISGNNSIYFSNSQIIRSILFLIRSVKPEVSFQTPYKLRAGLLLQSEKKLRFFHDISGKPTLGSEEVILRLPSFSPKYILSSSYSSRCTYIKISLISSICFSIVIMITLSPT